MNYQRDQVSGKWWHQIWVVPSGFRILAFAIGTLRMLFLPLAYQPVVPPLILITGLGIYTLVRALYPFRWYESNILSRTMLGVDIALCIFLVMSTGGLDSPFLVYTLVPVVTAALLLHGRVAFSIAGLSAVYVIGSHLWNPFLPIQFSVLELSRVLVYITIVFLATALPYLINVNLRQRLQSEDILWERQRLSREIHDGAAQTASALRWQVQLVHRRLIEMGIELDEVTELVRLATRGQQDTRECLELLRNYTGGGSFLPHLKDYLEHLGQDTNIRFSLDAETGELRLNALVEIQLLRICQEALINIRRHSGAHNVRVTIKSVDNHLKVSIADDGCGFDVLAYYRDGAQTESQGLAVMQERAESIGGRLQVLSTPGQGTKVQVEIPLTPYRGRPWLNR